MQCAVMWFYLKRSINRGLGCLPFAVDMLHLEDRALLTDEGRLRITMQCKVKYIAREGHVFERFCHFAPPEQS